MAITLVHQLAGLHPIVGPPVVSVVLLELHRQLAKPKTKKEAVTSDMLSAILKSCDGSH